MRYRDARHNMYVFLYLCPYVNKVGGAKLSQCRIGQDWSVTQSR